GALQERGSQTGCQDYGSRNLIQRNKEPCWLEESTNIRPVLGIMKLRDTSWVGTIRAERPIAILWGGNFLARSLNAKANFHCGIVLTPLLITKRPPLCERILIKTKEREKISSLCDMTRQGNRFVVVSEVC